MADNPVKQVDNKLPPNPSGKGGFGDHPELINKKGRPPKGWAWSEVFEDLMEETDTRTGKKYKELVSKAILNECLKGNVLAIRELFNRMEGLPRAFHDITSGGQRIEGIDISIITNETKNSSD